MKSQQTAPNYVMVHVHCPEITELPIMSHFVWLGDAVDGGVKVEVSRYVLDSIVELMQGK